MIGVEAADPTTHHIEQLTFWYIPLYRIFANVSSTLCINSATLLWSSDSTATDWDDERDLLFWLTSCASDSPNPHHVMPSSTQTLVTDLGATIELLYTTNLFYLLHILNIRRTQLHESLPGYWLKTISIYCFSLISLLYRLTSLTSPVFIFIPLFHMC